MTTKTRVLVVDDELAVRAFMDEALHFLGYEVAVASDGEVALAWLERARFDLIVTDHRMPRLTGLQLVRELRAREYPGRVFVISGTLSAEERAAYAALQVDGVAEKPLGLAQLAGLLRGAATPVSVAS